MNLNPQPGKEGRALGLVICLLASLTVVLKGDLLEMTNGDRYTGKVVSVTQSNVTFQSEIQGTMNLPRGKVARVSFEEALSRPPGITPSVAKTNETVKPLPKVDFDAKSLSQVQQELLSTASPEARREFHETVKGLMTGKLTIDDIRTQARNAVKDIKAAKEELGEGAADAFDGYLRILERFLSEADQPTIVAPVSKPQATNSLPAKTLQR
jgi:hypothetical protein